MPNEDIQIGSLDFQSIKAELKAHVTQNTDFQTYYGDAFDTLLDVFAYNTLYYAYYSNMVANESFLTTAKIENNIVSLLKPLGIMVKGKSCSKKTILVSSAASSTILGYQTSFYSTKNNASYNFYTTEDIVLTGTPQPVTVYESVIPVKNIKLSVNIKDQTAFISNNFVDIDTITVKVNGETWSKFDTRKTDPGANSKVYFIDRTSTGFYLIFGRKTINDYQESYGKKIVSSDKVTISYLLPSGSVANGIGFVDNTSFTIDAPQENSFAGSDGPDLNLIKYFAPKVFAANDRAVTRDDYYGLLLNSGLLPISITNTNQINVWGGEETIPQIFGRVFISLADTTIDKLDASVMKSMNFIKNKSVVSIIPEYVVPQGITANIGVRVLITPELTSLQKSNLKQSIEKKYNDIKIFNNKIIIDDIISYTKSLYPQAIAVTTGDVSLSVDVFGSNNSTKIINFNNNCRDIGIVENSTSTSWEFGAVQISGTIDSFGNSDILGTANSTLKTIGTINRNTGYVVLNVLKPGNHITVYVLLTTAGQNILAKNETILGLNCSIS